MCYVLYVTFCIAHNFIIFLQCFHVKSEGLLYTMLFLVVESHVADTSAPTACGAQQCDWISLAHQQTLLGVLKHYEICTNPLVVAVCQLRSQNFSSGFSNACWEKIHTSHLHIF